MPRNRLKSSVAIVAQVVWALRGRVESLHHVNPEGFGILSQAPLMAAVFEQDRRAATVQDSLLESLEECEFSTSWMDMMLEREARVLQLVSTVGAPPLATLVRWHALTTLGFAVQCLGLSLEMSAKGAALLDLFVAAAPEHLRGPATVPTLVTAVLRLVTKLGIAGQLRQEHEGVLRQCEDLSTATLVQNGAIANEAEVENQRVTGHDVAMALVWEVDPPTIFDFVRAMSRRVDVATQGAFTGNLKWANQQMHVRLFEVVTSQTYSEVAGSKSAAGVVAMQLAICGIVSPEILMLHDDWKLPGFRSACVAWSPAPCSWSTLPGDYQELLLILASLAMRAPVHQVRLCAEMHSFTLG